MTGISPPVKAAKHSKRSRRERQCHGTSCVCGVSAECCRCMGSLPDGQAKCCHVDALARQHANAFEHAIWKRHVEYNISGLGKETDSGASFA